MFKTNFYFFNVIPKNKTTNFYGDQIDDLVKKESTYYGFDHFIKKVKLNNPAISADRFNAELPRPFSYYFYPISFEKYLEDLNSISFKEYFYFSKVLFFKAFFINFFCSIFNITPYVTKLGSFKTKTFSGFTFVSFWFNLHFFLPYVFGSFTDNEIKGTFYDHTFPIIRIPRQVFCNFFYRIFSGNNSSSAKKKLKKNFLGFIFIYIFIFFIPFILTFIFIYIFISFFIYIFFFILWRDRVVFKNYFSNSTDSFIYVEFWHITNFFYDKIYQFYVSSFIFFCEFPGYFSNFNNFEDETGSSTVEKVDTKYVHVVNRIFYYSAIRRFFKYTFYNSFYSTLFLFLNFFGIYNFSQLNHILNSDYHGFFSSKFNGFTTNKILNAYDRLFLFSAYLNNNDGAKFKPIEEFSFYKVDGYNASNYRKLYKDSIFKWPLLTINSIGEEHHNFYKNWHFSKFNIEFIRDSFHFPFIDPDFSNFYAKELSSNQIFLSNFSRYDLNRLYGYHVWKTAKTNKFDFTKIWKIFYTSSVSQQLSSLGTNSFSTTCYDNILDSTSPNISYFFSRFGLTFVPHLSIFSFFLTFFRKIFDFISFFYYIADSFFHFHLIFSVFFYLRKKVYDFFSVFFYSLYFFFLKASYWSFIPFFDHIKNFYINFYTFYTYTNFMRDFYFERSVNKTFFIEGLEETDDEETHFTDTIEQSFYNYWWQDFEMDLDAINFFHDEVYDQFTDVFDYEDDEPDYFNTLYTNDDDVEVQHYDFEVHGLDNFRDSDFNFSDEVDQDDFEDSYEDLEHFFSPIEESSSFISDSLLTSVIFIRNIIYDVSDLDRTVPYDRYFNSFGPYTSFELHNASYDLYASFWRIYLYNYWGSNVPINDDFKHHINSQLTRYVNYLDKWHSVQLSSGKYIKVPNIIRSFGDLSYVNKSFSKVNFEKLTITLNNTLFPRSIIKKIYFPEQIDIIWNKIGRIYSSNPSYVISVLERPDSEKIFELISKSGFEFKVSKSGSKIFYFFENFFIKKFSKFFDKFYSVRYEREFITNFFGQFYDISSFKGLTFFSPEVVKNVLDIINRINKPSNDSNDFFFNPYFFITNKDKFDFVKISYFNILCCLFILFFLRKYERFITNREGNVLDSTFDIAYTRLIELFSSIQFSTKRIFYTYLKIVVKRYVLHHNATGEFSVIFKKSDLYDEILNASAQQDRNLASFDILGDLGLFWSDLVPNIKKVYKSWNDPFLASLFFPEQFYVILDYANISTFDDEDVDMYEEKIDYFTETSTGDLYDDPYESEASPILEDTSADPDEENFYRGEAVVTTVLYEDLFDEDDEYFNPDIHWYEQIEDEPEFDEWDIDFFDEIEDINIPMERIFFGEFYRKFMVNTSGVHNKDMDVNSYKRTAFYSFSKTKSSFFGYSNFSEKNVNSLVTNSRFKDVADIYTTIGDKNSKKFPFNANNSNTSSSTFSYFFKYFVSTVITFFVYFSYSIRGLFFSYSIEYTSSLRQPLTSLEEIELNKHYKKYSHIYNAKFFVEFSNFVLSWIKTYESFNSRDRLKHVTFEMIRSNLRFDNSVQSPLFHSPYSFSWFEDSNIPTDFKWEFYDYLKTFFDLSSSPSFDEDFTVLMEDFIKDFYNSEEIQNIKNEEGQEYFEDAFDFGLFILSAFVIDHEDPYFYSENFFYSTLINLYFSKNKKFPLHSDLYAQDIYKIFEDDWNAIQNEVGFYKEDSSAWLNLLDNPPEDDYIEDPVTPFYVSEEHIVHSSKEYTNKFIIILDAVWEFFSLIFDYNIYWFRLTFKTYVISYYEALSSFFDKSWFNLSIKYGIWVYFIRSFISFSFFAICSLYIIFIVPRLVFIYTTSHFQLFFSIFFSGVISFFMIIFLLFALFFSVYQSYKDINEYERSTFYFAAFISWFTVVWYSIVGYDIYETDDSSSNIFPSVDPDPTLAPDSAILEMSTPEIIDFDPNWADTDRASWKPFIAPQPVTFGYFIDVFFSQYLNVAHRSLTGHKFRQRFQYPDPIGNYFTSDSIGNYVNLLRRKENFVKGGKGIYGHYGSERNFNKTSRFNTRSNVLKTVAKTSKWVTRYSDLRYTTQRLARLRRIDPTNFFLAVDYDWKGMDPLFGYKDDDRDFDEDKYYKGRNTYSSVTDHSRYFVRNYYDEDQGDHEMVMWNIHYRPYDWFSSNYLSRGFFNSVKKYRPFNFSFDPKNYYNSFTNYLHFFEPVVKFTDYRLPNKLYFAQKFVYGSSVYHYKISSLTAPYSDNKSEVFRRFNPEAPKYEHYISTLVSKSTEFNFLKHKAEKIHFKYFYFNRYRYYISKVNPNSRLFSRASFDNVGGWPITKGSNIDIYSYDYPLFMENIRYKIIGYDNRLKMINYHYYLSIKRPDFSFRNMDLFYWIVANFKKTFQLTATSDLSLLDRHKFFMKKLFVYMIYFNDKNAVESKLFDIENDYLKLEQSKRYTFYWNLFWNKTTSNTFHKNTVALPSSALLLNPNYLPKNYNNILAIRRHYLDSMNFNSRIFSRKQFKRFWYRSSFVPLIDTNPIRFSERFNSFKAYESGLPVSPTFSKKVSDPISKFIRRGVRRPVVRDNYSDFIVNKYYRNFFDNIINYDKINNYFSDEDTSFIRFVDTNLFTTPDLRPFNNYSYDIIFGRLNDDNKRNFYNNNVYAAFTENSNIFKFLYSYDLMTKNKFKKNLYKDFFDGKNSRYYLKQIYRYPFSRSLFRSHYDAINENTFNRNNIFPAPSFYTIFNGFNLLPYDGEAKLKTPEYSPLIRTYEDKSTSISNYFRARFNRNSIGNYKLGQYGYITDVRLRNIYYTNRFKWAGRHTGGINSNVFRIFKRNHNATGQRFLGSKFNVFPLQSKIPNNNGVTSKDFANLMSKISSQEVKSMKYYNVEYDWPGNKLIKDEYVLKYPYTSFLVLDDSYIGTSSILNGKGLYPFYTSSGEDKHRTDMFQEIFETTPEIFLGPYLVRDLITKVEHDVRYSIFNRRLSKFNITKNSNMGLFDPIDFENIEHPRSFLISKKNQKTRDTKGTLNLTKFSDTPYVLRMEAKRFKDLKFGLSIKSNLSAYIYGLDRTPIYSKNYSRKFQKKDAFFSAGVTKLDVIKKYSWGDEEFNKYVQAHHLSRFKKYDKISDDSKISKVYENSKNDSAVQKFEKLEFINKLKYSNFSSSPLERYILSSHNTFTNFYMHSPFPFVRQGKAMINIINNRRDIYRTRIMARLQKYVSSDAFERAYSRVFSGSRVPFMDNDPIKIILNNLLETKDDLYPAFEIWADKRFNDHLTLKEIKMMVQMVKKGLITKEEFITKFRKVEKVKSNFVSTFNIGQKESGQLEKGSFANVYPKFYSHVNISDILSYKLKKSRLYNPQFMNKKDLEFIAKNAKLLSKKGKEFMPERTKVFSRQTPSSLRVHEYVINRNLTRSENFHKQMKKVRIELDKFRPGSIRKDSFVISKNVNNFTIYPMKDGKVVVPQKRNEFLTEFEKSNAKVAKTFKKKKIEE